LRCNVCDDVTVKEKCDIWCEAERYLLIIISDLTLFWAANFLQTNYTLRMMFCDVNSTVTVIKWAFLIKFVNNDSSVTWESKNEMQKDGISSLKRLNKYNYVYMQQQNLCCCLFCITMLFRMCILSLLYRYFVDRFVLRCLYFLYIIFIFVLFCFCILFQWSKYINDVIYSICCILYWLSSCRLNLQNWFWWVY